MLRIGLTGGIASGKSVVAEMFVQLGASLVDTDTIARDLVAPGAEGHRLIAEAFGSDVFDKDDRLDRAAMRRLVFADAAARAKLEHILHPLIRRQARSEMSAAAGPYVIAAVPLLVETGFAREVDRVLLVHTTPELQLQRLIERDSADSAQAQSMIDAQASESERLAAADDVIDNTGSLEDTKRQVAALHAQYVRMGRDCRAGPPRAE